MPEIVSTLNPSRTRERWLAPSSRRDLSRSPPTSRSSASASRITSGRICFVGRCESMLAQTYDNIEIIVVDDGSRMPAAQAYLDEIESTPARFPITVIRGHNRYLGAARNAGAKIAKGEYLLFHDDDNFAEPNEVETFVAAALAYGADILTAQCYVFHDGELGRDGPTRRVEFYPIGIGGVFSFFLNRFGDANALVRRSVFEELGGFTEELRRRLEDWEFFLKAYHARQADGHRAGPALQLSRKCDRHARQRQSVAGFRAHLPRDRGTTSRGLAPTFCASRRVAISRRSCSTVPGICSAACGRAIPCSN